MIEIQTYLGNLFCLAGTIMLMAGHAIITAFPNDVDKGFNTSGWGAMAVTTGSILLGSWPLVALNAAWAYLSFAAREPDQIRSSCMDAALKAAAIQLFVVGLALLSIGYYTAAAFCVTGIYLISYSLFTAKAIGRECYLVVTAVAAFLLFPHLVEHKSFAVLGSELLALCLSVRGIWLARRQWKEWAI